MGQSLAVASPAVRGGGGGGGGGGVGFEDVCEYGLDSCRLDVKFVNEDSSRRGTTQSCQVLQTNGLCDFLLHAPPHKQTAGAL